MFSRGYFTIFRFRGTPVRVHWTFPIGAFFFTGLNIPGFIAFFVVIFVHELGHAFFVRRYRLATVSIDLHAMGGECRYMPGHETSLQRAVIAWGGILGQAVLLVGAQGAAWLATLTGDARIGEVAATTLTINAYVMLLNAIPCPPLDGWEAWRLFRWSHLRMLLRRAKRAPELRHWRKPETKQDYKNIN
jgi:Zn-dependent protease